MILINFEAESLILRPPALHFLKSSVLRANAPAGAFLFPKNDKSKKTNMICYFRDRFSLMSRLWGLHFLKSSVLQADAPAGAFLFPKNDT